MTITEYYESNKQDAEWFEGGRPPQYRQINDMWEIIKVAARKAERTDRLIAALEFIAGGDCPPHGLEKNCVKNNISCSDCLREFAREALAEED